MLKHLSGVIPPTHWRVGHSSDRLWILEILASIILFIFFLDRTCGDGCGCVCVRPDGFGGSFQRQAREWRIVSLIITSCTSYSLWVHPMWVTFSPCALLRALWVRSQLVVYCRELLRGPLWTRWSSVKISSNVWTCLTGSERLLSETNGMEAHLPLTCDSVFGRGKVRLHASVTAHVMHDRPWLQGE